MSSPNSRECKKGPRHLDSQVTGPILVGMTGFEPATLCNWIRLFRSILTGPVRAHSPASLIATRRLPIVILVYSQVRPATVLRLFPMSNR